MVFRLFRILTRKTCVFAGKFFGRVVKKIFDVSNGTFIEQIFRIEISKTRGLSKNFEIVGTMMEKRFQVWQNSNRCPREQFMKTFFSQEKSSLFSDSEPMFTSSEIFCQSCETRNLCIRGSFWGKTIFEIYIIFHTFFGLWSKKRLVGKRFFSRVVTTAIRASRDFFWEKVLFF